MSSNADASNKGGVVGGAASDAAVPLLTTGLQQQKQQPQTYGATTTTNTGDDNGQQGSPLAEDQQDDDMVDVDDDDEHKTTVRQTFIHLLKGYIGCGVLSLPWAVSQLGYLFGFSVIVIMALWSSYNCWTVVRLKRFVEHKMPVDDNAAADEKSDTGSVTSSNITYPDVGEYLYGQTFQAYTAIALCTQQLAICTVFLSFIGENLQAVLQYLGMQSILSTHVGVLTTCLPLVMGLSFIPSLKLLTPVMATGTIIMLVGFGVLGLLVEMEWSDRPTEPVELNMPQMPLAVCAILYSYEGICLILPIESAMKEPQHFQKVFWVSMSLVAMLLGSVACLCVLAFGHVTSGSVTAFLLNAYADDESVTMWIMIANTAVSLSVLLTYPLQLFPTIELIGPWITNKLAGTAGGKLHLDDENDLEGFDPLPPLMEHEQHDFEDVDLPETHLYEATPDEQEEFSGFATSKDDNKDADDEAEENASLFSAFESVFPEMTIPGDSPWLRACLVIGTYLVAVVVPNVQALISLAGALAGSSTALLIPPLLELAWIRHMENDIAETALPAASVSSPTPTRTVISSTTNNALTNAFGGTYWFSKLKNYFLFAMGSLFCAIGTWASLADIIAIYRGK